MNDTIEILKKWCDTNMSHNIYNFYFVDKQEFNGKIVLTYYSSILDEKISYFFVSDVTTYYNQTNTSNVDNIFLLKDILYQIRINNLNKILNKI